MTDLTEPVVKCHQCGKETPRWLTQYLTFVDAQTGRNTDDPERYCEPCVASVLKRPVSR